VRQGHALYTGYDMRLCGCRAIVEEAGNGMYLVQFDEIQENPVHHPGKKTKPDDPKFKYLAVPDEPLRFCVGWHLFTFEDFKHVNWGGPEVEEE